LARVVVTATAAADLAGLIRTHSLPPDTIARFSRSMRPLAEFPRIGPELVALLAVVDARSGTSPTSGH